MILFTWMKEGVMNYIIMIIERKHKDIKDKG